MTEWERVCVLCVARETDRLRRHLQREPTTEEVLARVHRLPAGHCCTVCATRIGDDLTAIGTLAMQAAASITPRQGRGGSAAHYGPRVPINCAAVDAELTMVELNVGDPSSAVTILEILEMHERAIREDRQMSAYGPVSATRQRTRKTSQTATQATLLGCIRFLVAQLGWIVSDPQFGLEDFADQTRRCAQALRHWDPDLADQGTMVRCPSLSDRGECGYPLRYYGTDDHVTCPRCGMGRDVTTLIAVAMADGREVWLDPEAAAQWLGVSERSLRRLVSQGKIARSHGRYRIRSGVTEAHENLARAIAHP